MQGRHLLCKSAEFSRILSRKNILANFYELRSTRSNFDGPLATCRFSIKRDRFFFTINTNLKLTIFGILPLRHSLTRSNCRSSLAIGLCTIREVLSNDLGVSSADIAHIGSLAAALELGGEYGNSDGDEDGRQRLIFDKSVRILVIPPF